MYTVKIVNILKGSLTSYSVSPTVTQLSTADQKFLTGNRGISGLAAWGLPHFASPVTTVLTAHLADLISSKEHVTS